MLSIISLTENGFRSGVDGVDDDVDDVLDDVVDDDVVDDGVVDGVVDDDLVDDVVEHVVDDVKDGKVACVEADGEVNGVIVVAIGDVVVVCELDGILCCCVFVDCEVGTRYPTAPS